MVTDEVDLFVNGRPRLRRRVASAVHRVLVLCTSDTCFKPFQSYLAQKSDRGDKTINNLCTDTTQYDYTNAPCMDKEPKD